MAIFMASTKPISRSKKQSAVAAACYRTADKIADERYGKTHDYTKRSGVMSADIIMPAALKNTVITRSELWNLAERSENRKKFGLSRAKDEVKEIRELWETLANAKLEEQDHLLIDSRSYKSQGIRLMAQIKLGKDATHMERKGISTDKGDMNRSIAERNQRIWRHQLRTNKRINMRITENARKNINDRRKLKAETNDDTIRRVERNKRSIEWASNRLEWSDKKWEALNSDLMIQNEKQRRLRVSLMGQLVSAQSELVIANQQNSELQILAQQLLEANQELTIQNQSLRKPIE